MKPISRLFRAVIAPVVAIAMVLGAGFAGVASAAVPYRAYPILFHGYADATAAQTFATTSYADLAAATVSVQANRYASYNASGEASPVTALKPYLRITWSASVSKATATDGTCAIYVNGAIVAGTARLSTSAAGSNSIGGFYEVVRSSNAAQTVKLQCKSGDTNVFTVNFANIRVEEVIR